MAGGILWTVGVVEGTDEHTCEHTEWDHPIC